MKTLLRLKLALLFSLLLSCGEENKTKTYDSGEENKTKTYDIGFTDVSIQRNEEIEIFLTINGRNYALETISGMGIQNIPNEYYSDYDIPNDALSAIQNYWAGLQSIYYIKDLNEVVSVRKATRVEGESLPLKFEELLRVKKDESKNTDILKGVFEFVECYPEGEELILVFKNNNETIEVWDAPNNIWEMNDWESQSEKLKGLRFNIEFDKTNHYLSICTLSNKTNNSISKNTNRKEFYILNVLAVKSKSKAIEEVKKLTNKGYEADFLWIPDYNSLSRAEYYSVYIGPFNNQKDCERSVEKHRGNVPEAYGLLVSQENKRVQINGINKVKITEPYHQDLQKNNANSYSNLSDKPIIIGKKITSTIFESNENGLKTYLRFESSDGCEGMCGSLTLSNNASNCKYVYTYDVNGNTINAKFYGSDCVANSGNQTFSYNNNLNTISCYINNQKFVFKSIY